MVWELFGDNVPKLTAAAKLIMTAIDDETIINIAGDHTDDAWEDQEGSVYTSYHKRRERKDVKSKKIKAVLKAGKTICCEACGFILRNSMESEGVALSSAITRNL